MSIAIGMSERFYKAKSRYNSFCISALMMRIVHQCKSANLVDLKTGSELPGMTTWQWSTKNSDFISKIVS